MEPRAGAAGAGLEEIPPPRSMSPRGPISGRVGSGGLLQGTCHLLCLGVYMAAPHVHWLQAKEAASPPSHPGHETSWLGVRPLSSSQFPTVSQYHKTFTEGQGAQSGELMNRAGAGSPAERPSS